jgi:hypothetical protein
LCNDVGHTFKLAWTRSLRSSSLPTGFDIHKQALSDAQANTIEVGHGIMIFQIIRTLVKINIRNGIVRIRKSENDPLPGLAESVGVRGVMATI